MSQNLEKLIEELLRLLSAGDETKTKDMKDYKFWKTQPVPLLDEEITNDGPIEEKTPDEVSDQPLPLLPDFEWCTVNVGNDDEMQEVYDLLYNHYVEDNDAIFRFKYSPEFLLWALRLPGWRQDWHVGVRVKASRRLVAFIAAIPMTCKLTSLGNLIPTVEINFLTVHKKMRLKRMTPILIREITRRVNKQNIWQGLYTAGKVLPTPITTCRYTHRPLDWLRLNDVGFSHLPAGATKAQKVAEYALPKDTQTKGLRPMEKRDLDQVHALLHEYQERFELVQVFDKAELEHWLLGGEQRCSAIKTFVVETEGKVTDFFSYFLIPFSVLNHPTVKELGVAYLFYYATESAKELHDVYLKRLNALVGDALISAKAAGVDVFNALTSQDNPLFIEENKFGVGDGYLNYYLFNYKMRHCHGGIDPKTKTVTKDKGSGMGVVLF